MEETKNFFFGDFQLFEGEEIKMIIRKHWLSHIIIIKAYLFWGIVLPSVVIAGMILLSNVEIFSHFFWATLAITSAYSGCILLFFFTQWLNEMYDVIVITSDRVIDITQVDLFHRDIIETRLANVQDAMGVVNGFWNTFFNWGDLRIRTATDTSDFHISSIEKPHAQARLIFNFANEARKKTKKEETKMEIEEKKYERKRLMPQMYDRLQKLGILK